MVYLTTLLEFALFSLALSFVLVGALYSLLAIPADYVMVRNGAFLFAIGVLLLFVCCMLNLWNLVIIPARTLSAIFWLIGVIVCVSIGTYYVFRISKKLMFK